MKNAAFIADYRARQRSRIRAIPSQAITPWDDSSIPTTTTPTADETKSSEESAPAVVMTTAQFSP